MSLLSEPEVCQCEIVFSICKVLLAVASYVLEEQDWAGTGTKWSCWGEVMETEKEHKTVLLRRKQKHAVEVFVGRKTYPCYRLLLRKTDVCTFCDIF